IKGLLGVQRDVIPFAAAGSNLDEGTVTGGFVGNFRGKLFHRFEAIISLVVLVVKIVQGNQILRVVGVGVDCPLERLYGFLGFAELGLGAGEAKSSASLIGRIGSVVADFIEGGCG